MEKGIKVKRAIKNVVNEIDIRCLLDKLGFRANFKGYNILVEAIILKLENWDIQMKAIYSTLAKKFGTTASAIEKAMRHSIGVAQTDGKFELITDSKKINNSRFIADAAKYLLYN